MKFYMTDHFFFFTHHRCAFLVKRSLLYLEGSVDVDYVAGRSAVLLVTYKKGLLKLYEA